MAAFLLPNPVLGPHPLPLSLPILPLLLALTLTLVPCVASISETGPLLFLTIAMLHLPVSRSLSLGKSDFQVPRWIDPCKARPFTSIEPIRDFAGVPMTEEQEREVFDAVIAATRMAYTHGERIKSKFVSIQRLLRSRVKSRAKTGSVIASTAADGRRTQAGEGGRREGERERRQER